MRHPTTRELLNMPLAAAGILMGSLLTGSFLAMCFEPHQAHAEHTETIPGLLELRLERLREAEPERASHEL